jgi:hypothetical protein
MRLLLRKALLKLISYALAPTRGRAGIKITEGMDWFSLEVHDNEGEAVKCTLSNSVIRLQVVGHCQLDMHGDVLQRINGTVVELSGVKCTSAHVLSLQDRELKERITTVEELGEAVIARLNEVRSNAHKLTRNMAVEQCDCHAPRLPTE